MSRRGMQCLAIANSPRSTHHGPPVYGTQTSARWIHHIEGGPSFDSEAWKRCVLQRSAVLRRFLPLLEKEKREGKIKDNRRQQRQQKKDKKQQAKQQQQQQQPPEHEKEGNGVAAAAPNAGSSSRKEVHGARVLEGLAASGLRSIRYALEVPGIAQVDANDLDPAVVESMKRNVEFNGSEVQGKVHTLCSDARLVMMQNPGVYDAVDLDPYGTPSNLLDSAVQAVAEGGLLLITATDMANLCGNNSTACWSNYGSYPIHRPFCHEFALRILLACIETHANRYKRYIVPLLSLSVDFYVRVFVRVYTGPAIVKDSSTKLAYVWQSSGCDSFWLQRVGQKRVNGNSIKYMPGQGPAVPSNCPETGSGFLMGGPIWAEPIHDQQFVQGLLQDMDRERSRYAQFAKIKGMLSVVLEELPDVPLYYDLHDVCKTVKCTPPKMEVFRSALVNAGYRVSGSHANPLAVKTDSPNHVIWDIIRCWVKSHPVKADKDPQLYASKLLAKEPQMEANFSRTAGASSRAKEAGVTRFVQNPANWGPKSRHGRPAIQYPQPAGKRRKQGNADGEQQAEEEEDLEQQAQQEDAAMQEQDRQEQADGQEAAAAAGAAGVAAMELEEAGRQNGGQQQQQQQQGAVEER